MTPTLAPPRIRRLEPLLVDQIAAGEVVERPASVVKELLENAIDAGATRIDVAVTQGGTEQIRVVDDGCGIQPEDLALALTSHATSKIRQANDLACIRTLGFRGEALASIASVAQVILQSQPRSAVQGGQIRCEGGMLGAVLPWNGQPGTRMEVRHLFYNTPARRKFLKSTATEMGHITEAVTRLALGFPALGITLTHNDREIFNLPTALPLEERIRLFFGAEVGDRLLTIAAEAGPARLTGFIAEPAVSRGNSRLQYLFVNGRCVRDRTLAHAIQDAYHGLLMVGRYAVAFLFLNLPPDALDVNVHPAKTEVRFRDPSALYHLVRATLRARLSQHLPVPIASASPAVPIDHPASSYPPPRAAISTPPLQGLFRLYHSLASRAKRSFQPRFPRRTRWLNFVWWHLPSQCLG